MILTCSNMILQMMSFVYRIALTAYAGTEALGLNSLVMQVYQVVVSVCMSGLCVGVTAIAARLRAKESISSIRGLLKKAGVIFALLWFLMAAPIFFARDGIAAAALGDASAAPTLALMLVCILMTGVENILKSIHIGTGNVRQCAVSELCEQGIRFALVILLLVCIEHDCSADTVFLIMLGMVFSEFFSVGFLFTSYLRLFMRKTGDKLKCQNACAPSYKQILAITFPATLTALAGTLFSSVGSLLLPSRLMLAGLSRTDALSMIGILSTVAVPITLLPMAAVGALSSVSMPAIAECHTLGDRNGEIRITKRMLSLTGSIACVATAAIIPFAPLLSEKLFGVTAPLSIFVLLGIKAIVIYYQVASVAALNGLMQQRTVLIFAVIGEAFQLTLIALLSSIPTLNIYGYLIAMILGELCRLMCNLAMVEKHIDVSPIPFRQLLRTLLLMTSAYAVSTLCALGVENAFGL